LASKELNLLLLHGDLHHLSYFCRPASSSVFKARRAK
jgi:hypothetical protein